MSVRKLIYVPELNPNTFLFFYDKGQSGRSYSLRDYSHPPKEVVRYANEFPYTAAEILELAQREGSHCFDTEVHQTVDFDYWHQRTVSLNERHLGRSSAAAVPPPIVPSQQSAVAPKFPIVALDQLLRLPKATKREDMTRIFESPNSEDYVSWNIFNLLPSVDGWWRELLSAARKFNPRATEGLSVADVPQIKFWQTIAAPVGYEQANRQLMRSSGNAALVARASDPAPVEGPSEIDIVLGGEHQLIFIEAKLGSDISGRTTYDPERNQIIRNIDCLLDRCGDRVPAFWMVTRDCAPARSYVSVIQAYQSNPDLAVAALSHHPPELVREVVGRITIVLWVDLLRVIEILETLGEDGRAVLCELSRRVGGGVGGAAHPFVVKNNWVPYPS
jgi:hypothetical protein